MRAIRTCVIGLGATLVFAWGAPLAAASSIQISGAIAGCFTSDCGGLSRLASSVTDPTSGPTLTDSSSGIVTELSTAPWDDVLGAFVLGRFRGSSGQDSLDSLLAMSSSSAAGGGGGGIGDIENGLAATLPGALGAGPIQFLAGDLVSPQNETLTAVPEPASLVLLGGGLLAVARRVRRTSRRG